jgi:hypothetical protein
MLALPRALSLNECTTPTDKWVTNNRHLLSVSKTLMSNVDGRPFLNSHNLIHTAISRMKDSLS